MYSFRQIIGVVFGCLLPAVLFGYDIDWSGPTAAVEVGQQYTVTATTRVNAPTQLPSSIQLYRNGAPIGGGGGSAQYMSPGETIGGQTIRFTASARYQDGTPASSSFTVTVKTPQQHAPTVAWQTTQINGVFGEQISIIAIGHDVDGDLSSVNIWRDTQAFAFELQQLPDGTPTNYGAFAGRPDPMPSEIRKVHYYAQAVDKAGNVSEWADLYIDVKGAHLPNFDSLTYSVPYIYQTTNVVVHAYDIDNDLRSVGIVFPFSSVDEAFSPEVPFPGQYQITHTGRNHKNPGPHKGWESVYIFLKDWSGNDIQYQGALSVFVDNRAPLTPIFVANKTTIVIGGSVTLATTGHDNDGNMTGQNLIIREYIGPGANDYGPPIPVTGFSDANGVYDHTLTVEWTPPETGTYQIFGRSNDPDEYADSSYIIVTTTPPPPPNPPTNFIAGIPIAATIPLTWTASTSDHVAGYILTWGPVDGEQKAFTLGWDQVGYIASLLSPGVSYQFVLKTKNEAGVVSAATPPVTATAAKLDQSITFNNPGTQTYNTPFPQTAYSASGLAITYTISGPVVVEGANFRANGVGQVTITAQQPGNSVYTAAQDVAQTFTVSKASQTLLFYNPGTHAYGDPAFDLGASVNTGLPISYSVTGPATRVGSMLTVTGAGTVGVTATQAGNENYYPASITQNFTVNRAAQTITFAGPNDHTYGDPAFDLTASATSNLPVSFSIISGPATISGTKLTMTAAGSITVRASQGGDTDHYQAATNVDRTFNVSTGTQSAVSISPATGTVPSGGSITFTASGGGFGGYIWGGTAGATGSGTTKTVQFNTAGPATVTVSSPGDASHGASNTATANVTVTNPLILTPVFANSPAVAQTVNLGGSITFTSTATDLDGNMTFHNLDWINPDGVPNWQGGDGATASEDPDIGFWPKVSSTRSVTLTFNRLGVFKVSWSAQDPAGWVDSAPIQITVVNSSPPVSGASTARATVGVRLAITAKGAGTVRLSINGSIVEYIFNQSPGLWGEPQAVTDGLDKVGPYLIADDTNYPVQISSQGVTDYVVTAHVDPSSDSYIPRSISFNDRFLDAIAKSEVEGQSSQFQLKSVRTASLPFGLVDFSKLETARIINFGLGTNTAGVTAGIVTFDASPYLYDLTKYTVSPPAINLNAGPGLREQFQSVGRFQARSSSGFVDVQRTSTAFIVRFFKDGDYASANGIRDFGSAVPLVEYDIDLSNPTDTYTSSNPDQTWRAASQFALTRKIGLEQRLFECRTDYFAKDGASHLENPNSDRVRWLRSYETYFRIWAWRVPSAVRQFLTEIAYHSQQDIVQVGGSGIEPQILSGIQLAKAKYSGATRDTTRMHYEFADYSGGDTWLASAPANVYQGGETGEILYIRGEGAGRVNEIDGQMSASATGGKSFTEFYHAWRILDGSNLGDQPISAAGKPKTIRQSFLDDTLGSATDLITTNRYVLGLNNTKTLLESAETKQGGQTVGKKAYLYSTINFNSLEALQATENLYTSSSSSLTTVSKVYSSRVINRDFADKPISITRPDLTKTSYAYERGDLSGTEWTANTNGGYLRVAELTGKSGSGVSIFQGTAVDPLDMDIGKSIVSERIVDSFGRIIRETNYVYTGGVTFAVLTSLYYAYDDFGNLIAKSDKPMGSGGRALYQAGYTGFRKDWEVDDQGTRLTYTYDGYERVQTAVREGAGSAASLNSIAALTTTYAYDEIGRTKSETVSASGESETFLTSSTYDSGSRLKTHTTPGGFTTKTTYNSEALTTLELPDGGQQIIAVYKDGRPKSKTGSAVTSTTYDYSFDSTGLLKTVETLTGTGKASSAYSDWAGRAVRTENATWSGGTRVVSRTYNSQGQLTALDTLAGAAKLLPTHLYEYDLYGRLVREGMHVGAGGSIDVSADLDVKDYNALFEKKKINRIDDNTPVTSQSEWYRHETVAIYPYGDAKSSTGRFASETFQQVSGLTDGLASHTLSADFDRNWTQTFVSIAPSTKSRVSNTLTTGTDQVLTSNFTNGFLTRSTNAQGQVTLQTYDGLGRLEGVDDPRIGLSSYAYVANSTLIKTVTAPDLKTTQFEYDSSGRKSAQFDPQNKVARYRYDVKGNLTHTWGDTVDPVRFVYNDLGQRTEMHTYRAGSWTGASLPTDFAGAGDTTTWSYHAATGLLTSKSDATGGSTGYQYDNLDRTTKRTDARSWVTNYTYFPASDPSGGQLSSIVYVDGTTPHPTPSISYTYHRSGKLKTVTDAGGVHNFDYYETWSEESYDAELRNKSGRLKGETVSGFFGLAYDYQYGVAGRQNGNRSSLKFGGAYTVNYGYDSSLRLSTIGYNSVTPFSYSYVGDSNLVGNVTQMTAPSSYNYRRHYDYETTSNRVSGIVQNWGANANTQLQSTSTYDGVGLRNSEKLKGSDWANSLFEINGGVESKFSFTDRYEITSGGKYAMNAAGTTGGLIGGTNRSYAYDNLGNRASDQAGLYTPNGLNQYDHTPYTTQTLIYDANGNLTSDGIKTYFYDGENRLIKVSLANGTVCEYSYDYLGRRISKSQNGSVTARFVYDGWNVVAELNGSAAVVRTHVWGLDASGTLQGAGGVGGLLLTQDVNGLVSPFYDAAYNVVSLVDQSGATVGAFEYDPFGNVIKRGSGRVFPFLHATKYWDEETSLYYYGLRYCNPQLGRFINRDPSGESGGINLYKYDRNNPIQNLDAIGLDAKSGQDRRDAEEKARQSKEREEARQRVGGNLAAYTQLELPSIIETDFANIRESQKNNTGSSVAVTPHPFGDTRVVYENYGDPTGEASDAPNSGVLSPADAWRLKDAELAGQASQWRSDHPIKGIFTNPYTDQRGALYGQELARRAAAHEMSPEQQAMLGFVLGEAPINVAIVNPFGTASGLPGSSLRYCFPAGTLVSTPTGKKPIEQMREGDEVLSWDFDHHKVITKKVTTVFARNTTHLLEIKFGDAVLKTTGNHPFWVKEKGWILAEELRPGMKLLGLDGAEREITEVLAEDKIAQVFNFEVAGTNNYFAGNDPVLVHNQTAPHTSFNGAMNEALGWLNSQGVTELTDLKLGKFGSSAGMPIGMQTASGSAGYRIEFDARSGAHINVWAGKAEAPHIQFTGNEKSVNSTIRQLFGCR